MEIEIVSFGKIAEFIKHQKIALDGISDTDGLKMYLERTFPEIVSMKYKLALNKNIVQKNSPIKNQDMVAIMPPFSGG